MKVADFYTEEDVKTMFKQYRWKKGKDDYETFLKKIKRFEHIAANHLAGTFDLKIEANYGNFGSKQSDSIVVTVLDTCFTTNVTPQIIV